MEGESKYWKDITGMNKQQFLYAAKKEANDFVMFSGINLNPVDLNQMNENSNELRPLTQWDKMRLKAK